MCLFIYKHCGKFFCGGNSHGSYIYSYGGVYDSRLSGIHTIGHKTGYAGDGRTCIFVDGRNHNGGRYFSAVCRCGIHGCEKKQEALSQYEEINSKKG